jgi:hypothetical protein
MNIVPLIPDITVQIARHILPYAPRINIESNLPLVLNALATSQLADKPMVLMALATIAVETARFAPISEGESHYNTSPGGHAFDLYDSRVDLGNLGPPDGERFKGRGFIQLTGPFQLRAARCLHRTGESTDRRSGVGQRSRHRGAIARELPETSRNQDPCRARR